MLGSDFLAVVRTAMPTREELEDYGLDDDEIAGIQRTFAVTPREVRRPLSESASELERMILAYDCSTIEIGSVQFLDEPKTHLHGIEIACCEADAVVVRQDGSVSLFDHASPETVAMECAFNSESFLDGLAAFIEVRANKTEWKGRVEEAVEHCSNSAGGSQYSDFFKTLCGFLQ